MLRKMLVIGLVLMAAGLAFAAAPFVPDLGNTQVTQVTPEAAVGPVATETAVTPDHPRTVLGIPWRAGPRTTVVVLLGMGLSFASGLLILAIAWMQRSRSRVAQGSLPAPHAEMEALIYLVSARDKIIQSGIPGVFISLEKCLRDVGFTVIIVRHVQEAKKLLRIGTPAILGVDCDVDPKVMRQVDKLVRGHSPLYETFVFFYNVAQPEVVKPLPHLPNAVYMGTGFSSREVLAMVAPVFDFVVPVTLEGHPGETCSLQGKIVTNGLAEILQFLELGRRTGLLSLEGRQPAGVINFQEGAITYAQTSAHEGRDAVLEILALQDGNFHFFGDKRIRQTNCKLSALEVLLYWAHHLDESGMSFKHT